MAGSRFKSPALGLDLKALVRKGYRSVLISFFLALAFHLSLAQVSMTERGEAAVKPLSTKFVKREPRLVKPLELRKRPRPKMRTMKRKVVILKAKVSHRELRTSPQPLRVLDTMAKPRGNLSRTVSPDAFVLEPEFGSFEIASDRDPTRRIDMSLEMVDIDALDTGRYQAMVIQDPRDKKKIKGYFHMIIAYSESMRMRDHHGQIHRTRRGIMRLVNYINRMTGIKADVKGAVTLNSPEFFKVPWVYILTVTSFQLDEEEYTNLGRYMLSGGFVLGDITHHGAVATVPVMQSIYKMFTDALESQGYRYRQDWEFEKIPESHPIYHCFYDFYGGPPMGGDRLIITESQPDTFTHDYLEGIYIGERMVAIASQKWWANAWGDWGPDGVHGGYSHLDPTRQFQFGVNLVIFALTQEGSITNQVMQYVE